MYKDVARSCEEQARIRKATTPKNLSVGTWNQGTYSKDEPKQKDWVMYNLSQMDNTAPKKHGLH